MTPEQRERRRARGRTPEQRERARARQAKMFARRAAAGLCTRCANPLDRHSVAYYCGRCKLRRTINKTKRYYQQQAERTD